MKLGYFEVPKDKGMVCLYGSILIQYTNCSSSSNLLLRIIVYLCVFLDDAACFKLDVVIVKGALCCIVCVSIPKRCTYTLTLYKFHMISDNAVSNLLNIVVLVSFQMFVYCFF